MFVDYHIIITQFFFCTVRETQARYEEEARAKEIAHDNLMAADRRAHANQVLKGGGVWRDRGGGK